MIVDNRPRAVYVDEEHGKNVVVIENTSTGVGDSVLMSCLVSGVVKDEGRENVVYKVKKNLLPWLAMYKDANVATDAPPKATYHYPYSSYNSELEEHGTGQPTRLCYYYSRVPPQYVPTIPTWEVPPEELEWAKPYAGGVVLFPYAAWQSRNWPLRYWQDLEQRLIVAGKKVLIMHTDHEPISKFLQYKFWGQPAAKVAAIIALSECVICGDSGMGHLAGALKKRAITICGQVVGERVFTWDSVEVMQGSLRCSGCYWRGGGFQDSCNQRCENLSTITPEMVMQRFHQPRKSTEHTDFLRFLDDRAKYMAGLLTAEDMVKNHDLEKKFAKKQLPQLA